MQKCIYLNNPTDTKTETGSIVHRCQLHDFCVTDAVAQEVVSCISCRDRLYEGTADLAKRHLDPLRVLDRHDKPTAALRGMLAGVPSFLVCGGPSANLVDLSQLKQRGIFSLAVNNMAGKFWSNAFVCSDPPSKFHNGIWQDPTVMKFIPIPKMHGGKARLRERVPGEDFKRLIRNGKDMLTCHCPNVWGFERRQWIKPDDSFFMETSATWGNLADGVKRTGGEKTVNTTLLGIRLLYYLGSRRIFLVGCDFHMKSQVGLCENYAFPESKRLGAVGSNNEQYRISGGWLKTMQDNGTFQKFGLEIYNCYDRSGLRAFPYVPFEAAIENTLQGFPREPYDLKDWYLK